MRSANYIIAAAFVLASIGTAAAQSNPPTPSTTSTRPTYTGTTTSHWTASGFIGSNFNASADNVNFKSDDFNHLTFGGEVSYLWHGILGPQFIADFAPTFDLAISNLIDNPSANAYMLNAIGALPLGSSGQVTPYLSGGWGRINLSADVLDLSDNNRHNIDQGHQGTNIGGGVMMFTSNKVGFRGDLRRYHGSTSVDLSGTEANRLIEEVSAGLSFWRINGGVTFRW